jgi:hypothetical protein
VRLGEAFVKATDGGEAALSFLEGVTSETIEQLDFSDVSPSLFPEHFAGFA